MKTNDKKKISRLLIIVALAFTMIGYVTISKGDVVEWLFYIGALFGIVGLILSLPKK